MSLITVTKRWYKMYSYCNLAKKKTKPQRIFNRLQSYKKDGIRPVHVTKEIKNQIQLNSKGCEIRPGVN